MKLKWENAHLEKSDITDSQTVYRLNKDFLKKKKTAKVKA